MQKGFARKERVPAKHCEENIWIVKPEGLNQGRGIEVFRNLKEIQFFINSQPVSNSAYMVV